MASQTPFVLSLAQKCTNSIVGINKKIETQDLTKSEKAIANIYYEMGIPYKYEAPTTLFDGKIVYPDFTLLNIKTRTLIYHEHLGLLEDEKYRKKNLLKNVSSTIYWVLFLLKMSNYNRNGIILGSNFFITYETDYCPLNDNQIKNTIRAIFR